MSDVTCRHTKCPEGYVDWHQWAERKSETHRQERCPLCGKWAIWRKIHRESAAPTKEARW